MGWNLRQETRIMTPGKITALCQLKEDGGFMLAWIVISMDLIGHPLQALGYVSPGTHLAMKIVVWRRHQWWSDLKFNYFWNELWNKALHYLNDVICGLIVQGQNYSMHLFFHVENNRGPTCHCHYCQWFILKFNFECLNRTFVTKF